MLISQISKLGRVGVRVISAVGRATIMLFHALAGKPEPPASRPSWGKPVHIKNGQVDPCR